jgi:NADH-quinone oxidoreductase subunit L
LAAGVVIEGLHHEHNMLRMGGLRRELPMAFWSFLIGGSALAGLPLLTAGFYSKDLIVWGAWSADRGHPALWGAAMAGVLLTSLYTFRQIFLVFFGPAQAHVSRTPSLAEKIPLVVFGALSLVAGAAHGPLFALLAHALPPMREAHESGMSEHLSGGLAAAAFAVGLAAAYLFYLRRRPAAAVESALQRFWFSGWGMDWLYDRVFVRPVLWVARANRGDLVDAVYSGLAEAAALSNRALAATESGRLRWYTAGVALGSVIFVAMVLFL